MALYPGNMTYEEMMEELARLVALMIITDEQKYLYTLPVCPFFLL